MFLCVKALANDNTLLRTHCCSWCFLGAQTHGTQNECCVSMLRKLGNICCGHKMFLNKIRNIFLCPQQMLHKRANRETFVLATMCPRLPGPLKMERESIVLTQLLVSLAVGLVCLIKKNRHSLTSHKQGVKSKYVGAQLVWDITMLPVVPNFPNNGSFIKSLIQIL